VYSEIRQIRKQKGCNSGQFVCAVGETKIIFLNSILFIPCLGSCTEGDFRRNNAASIISILEVQRSRVDVVNL